jgi:hypothetical protein
MDTSRWMSAVLLSAFLIASTGCGATFPTIRDTTPVPWTSGGNAGKVFSAEATNAANFRVMLQFSSHRWVPSAHESVVAPTAGTQNTFVFPVPSPGSLVNTQRIFYRWLVLGRGPSDLDTIYAQTPDLSFQIGCAAGQMVTDLRADQAGVLGLLGALVTLTGPADIAALATRGYGTPTHGNASVGGMGLAIGKFPALGGGGGALGAIALGAPGLLLYAPAPGTNTTDVLPDFPYTLVGWAHGTAFTPGVRPTLGCFPFDEWFIHEAGWHEVNGSFTPTPPAETTPGTATITGPPFRLVPPPAAWHPRFWDMHVWLDTATGVPALGIVHPTLTIPGWPSAAGFFSPPLAP